MSKFYRTGTSVNDYIKSDQILRLRKNKQGTFINFEEYCINNYHRVLNSKSGKFFRTLCLDCREEIWFVRKTELDRCFTADQVEPYWIIHKCWKKNSNRKPEYTMREISFYLYIENNRLERKEKNIEKFELVDIKINPNHKNNKKTIRVKSLPVLSLNEMINIKSFHDDKFTISNCLIKAIFPGNISELCSFVVWAHTEKFRFELIISEQLYNSSRINNFMIRLNRLNYLTKDGNILLYIEEDNPTIIDAIDMKWNIYILEIKL